MATASLALVPAPVLVPALSFGHVETYLENARSRNTIRGYRSSWRQFEPWCNARGISALPASPETIAAYLADRANSLRQATLAQHLAAISKAHKAAGFSSPVKDSVLISETLKGVKRVHGTAAKQKSALLTDDLRVMLKAVPDKLIGLRDRALLLVGFAGAFRRSELVALDLSDLAFTAEGLLITLRRSKTDQEGAGMQKAIPFGSHAATCPVKAMRVWLEASGITEGAIFRSINRHSQVAINRLSDHAVALIVKKYAKPAGLKVADFSGHSLRAGFVTSAARAGEPERRIMRQTGHKSIEMVLRYIRQANIFQDNSALALGL